jgi:hypothetical protein
VTIPHFSAVDGQEGRDCIAKRPGFLSRESAPGKDNTWLVIVHWRSRTDAEASMTSFSTAPAAAEVISMIQPDRW